MRNILTDTIIYMFLAAIILLIVTGVMHV